MGAGYIYVLNDNGRPLMPTRRRRHIRRLLNTGKARIVSHVPFTVQLKYHSPGITQPVCGNQDPGRTNIGLSAIRPDGQVYFRAHLASRNKDVPKLMDERKHHRQASRRGERLVRKRLAKRNNTIMDGGSVERMLPGCGTAVTVKDIINTEARFHNRKRPEQWLTPTARHLVQTGLHAYGLMRKIIPLTDVSLEVNRFAFMRMDDGAVMGCDFQNGRMKGYASVKDYVYARQDGCCQFCGGAIEHYHHIRPRSKGGSDLPENIVGVCAACHAKIHTGQLGTQLEGIAKKYGALSVLNQAIPYIWQGLISLFGIEHVHIAFGYQTKQLRETLGLPKDHDIDSVCIEAVGLGITPKPDMPPCHEIRQFRRHDRQLVRKQSERTYCLDGRAVCKNRHKRFEQSGDSLEEFRQKHPGDVARLTVKKSRRSYNNPKRLMPGAVFLYRGERHVLTGTKNLGTRYMFDGCTASGVNPAQCQILTHNTGLVYLT